MDLTSGMTWENYGYGSRGGKGKRKGWDVEHIIPKSAYDHTNMEDVKRCWSLTNLRPMWHTENLSKTDKLTSECKTLPTHVWPISWNGMFPA